MGVFTFLQKKNNAYSTLYAAVLASSTTIQIQPSDTSNFPASTAAGNFEVTVWYASNNIKTGSIRTVTGVSGNTFTLSTTIGQAFDPAVGTVNVQMTITAEALVEHETNINTVYGKFPIQSADIGSGQVDNASMAANAVNTTNIVNSAVDNTKIAAAAVGNTQLTTTAINLDYKQITSSFTSTTLGADVSVTGLSSTVTIPSGGRRVRVTVFCRSIFCSAAQNLMMVKIKEGTTTLADFWPNPIASNQRFPVYFSAEFTPAAGSHTYNMAIIQDPNASTISVDATATSPAYISVDLL